MLRHMLYWLLQSQSAHPDLPLGQAPAELLTPQEQVQLDQFTSQQRRRDWLLGRWTAKRLLRKVIAHRFGLQAPLCAITIHTKPNGAPFPEVYLPLEDRGFNLSLSHKEGYALCAVVEGRHTPVGADLEWIEPRDENFVRDFSSCAEQALLTSRAPRLRDLQVTALWSAKEAALKATGQGLRIEPRDVSCLIEPVAAEPQNWIPFKIDWNPKLSVAASLPQLTGWWHVLGRFVLTVVTADDACVEL